MIFKREISGDISIEIDDDGQITIYSKHAEAEIVLTPDEYEMIEEAYEDWQFLPVDGAIGSGQR